MSSNANRWTAAEIEKLTKTYTEQGMGAAAAALPNRTFASIQSKVRDLKICVINPRSITINKKKGSWSDEEIKMLTEHFQYIGPAGVKKMMPKRTEGAITRKAYAMGLKLLKSDDQIRDNEELESFVMNVNQLHRPVGTWKAERPLVRSVFELAEAL